MTRTKLRYPFLIAAVFSATALTPTPTALAVDELRQQAWDPCTLGVPIQRPAAPRPTATTPARTPVRTAIGRPTPPPPVHPDSARVYFGQVTDSAGVALQDVMISHLGSGYLAQTDPNGNYRLLVPRSLAADRDSVTLRARLIGFAEVTHRAPRDSDAIEVDFQLQETRLSLQDILVTGTTDPAAGIKVPFTVHRLSEKTVSTAARAATVGEIQRRIAGAQIIRSGGQPGSGVFVELRTPGAEAARQLGPGGDPNREGYSIIEENPHLDPRAEPLSTFAIDVDRASYANVRRILCEGRLPPIDAVRIEELVNYHRYDLDGPTRDDVPFAMHTEISPAPWAPERHLVRIGIQGRRAELEALPPSNLVFLLDVSGSMRSVQKLELVKASMRLLVDELREQDRVAIVVYAGAAGLVLPSTSGSQKRAILGAIDRLQAGGSTAGGAGLRLAYSTARGNFIEGGNNRIILATDGDFNVGVSSDAEMTRLVEEERESGVFLSILGVGSGNLQDSKMEAMADHGNGNYAYLDNLREARKVLVDELESTLFTLAKDVKIQVEFNPERVLAYRLIGYENRLLAAQDFADDTKDAGELGAGHTVTALYEVTPVGTAGPDPARDPGPLRYQTPVQMTEASDSDELMFLRLRWKAPDGDRSDLIEVPIRDRVVSQPSVHQNFAAAVAGFGMLLRGSEHRGTASPEMIRELATAGLGADVGGWRAEFLRLIDLYEAALGACGDQCPGFRR